MTLKLLVKSNYRCRETFYPAGAVIDVDEAEAARLQADAPGVFVERLEKAIEKPPADKMVRRGVTK